MKFLKRFYEILAINDSCEAATVWDEIEVPNVFGIGFIL